MAVAPVAFSKKQVNRSGRYLRDLRIAMDADDEALERADLDEVVKHIEVVDWWRSRHVKPLARVNANLRYYIRKAGVREPDVTQRLKRFPTIIDKLRREPTMQLSNMEDIAGVRAILPFQQQVMAVRQALEAAPRWTIRRVRDYVAEPKEDGYRAVHVIVHKDGCYVEIQLRAPFQDAWAQSVEQDTRRLRERLKFGSGPDDLREYYRRISEMFAMRERNETPSQDFMEDLANLYRSTRRYFPGDDKSGTMESE
jgi:putative GTP pyrophosphokinase